jgi:nucleoside-diphosphate-sugar epimerase
MKVFLTGGTGFIGQHLAQTLVQQGHDVRILVGNRAEERAARAIGATPMPGDVTDRASLLASMAGCEAVFHAANHALAAGDDPASAPTRIVTGTQHTLGAAHDLDIPRIVFLSSISIFGDTGGELVDETFVPAQPPPGEIGRALWRAHYEVALPLLEAGAPIITVMPGVVYGPGDTGWPARLMRRFYRGALPVVPAPETTLTYAYVEDVARGCVLAAERGRIGESYCLTGPAVPLGELVEFWARLTGRRAPALSLSAHTLQTVTPLFEAVADSELAASLGGTTTAHAYKARQELGWTTQPMQPTTLETFEWIAATEPADTWEKRRHWGYGLAAVAGLLLMLWFLFGRRNPPSDD